LIIGIDLGTTFSVLAVSGRVELNKGYPPPTYLDELDVTIIPDPYGNDVIPSAVWEDPDNPGSLIVGTEARDRAAEGQAPILFSKRNIGTDVGHRLLGREYSAREVAKIILSYLKDIAEQALGERVDQAVITHPAFFEGSMMRETAEAARDAGFDFVEGKHLMMEPTAAALAYTGADSRDPLRLLTYDLGGGTFDVTVMERRRGVVTIKAFGGNRLLGGYTFDRRLANWLYERMRERGIRITLDEEDPRRHATWTRLLQIAEETKHKLANARTDRVPVHIREQFTDDDGRPVTLLDSITRSQYTALIQDLLDETLEGNGTAGDTKGCEVILAEAGLTIDQIDEILLVGGSSWGPWVADTIRRKWGRETRLLEPDRIVAAGAALHARSLPAELRGTGCSIELDVEPRSPLESITVAGRVKAETPTALAVALADDRGSRYVETPNDDGYFHFEDVELRPKATTRFTITVGEGEHRNIAEHHFEVEQIAEEAEETGTAAAVLTVLPKPLFVEVADGMEPLADEGATLPARRSLEFHRTNDFDTIEIRLFQEFDPIGSVVIKDVPPQATIGSKVILTVEINRSNKIEGRATAHTRAGTVIREAPVDIAIPRIEIPALAECKEWLATLEAELEDRLTLESDATVRMTLRAESDRLRRKACRLLESPVPDRQEVWVVLRALERIVRPPRDELDPPLAYFEDLLLRIRDILASHGSDPNIQAQSRIADRLEKEGRAAYARHQSKRWGQANEGLHKLLSRLEQPVRPPADDELPPADVLKMFALMELDQVRQQLRAKEAKLMDRSDFDRFRTRSDRIRVAIDDVQATIEQIPDDTPPRAAAARIQMVKHKSKLISDDIRLLDLDIRN
jgi:molecular chaperone DnaK (HSP70)